MKMQKPFRHIEKRLGKINPKTLRIISLSTVIVVVLLGEIGKLGVGNLSSFTITGVLGSDLCEPDADVAPSVAFCVGYSLCGCSPRTFFLRMGLSIRALADNIQSERRACSKQAFN